LKTQENNMSEYQWIEFRAIDAPLDDEQVKFMHTQSSRAEISRWSFTNEYNFGDFRGDAIEMMRRGYDLHVHYANFGIRRIYLRFPDGFAFADELESYLLDEEITWLADDQGSGGILMIDPEGDAGTWDWFDDVNGLASDLVPLREMIDRGDMRGLYMAHLSLCYEEDEMEPPVPAGLGDQNHSLQRLGEFLEFDTDLIQVASEGSQPLQKATSDHKAIEAWIQPLSKKQLADELRNLLGKPNQYPSQLLRQVRKSASTSPTSQQASRTIGALRARASEIEDKRRHEHEQAAEAERKKREEAAAKALQKTLSAIADNPDATLLRIDTAIAEKNRPGYQRAADELTLLAKACGSPLAQGKAEAIRMKYPARTALSSILKKAGF